ncbi:MAG: hypothetical protein A3D35_02555 [Candidatus Staskawiczbacteria bacterium RIFCSPHIGHO2_02_FULL_34_9]|uniref:Uncharacterized protein n=1 Tax=Candidatus Staskawiczbacteria bacterium RIFCSPHIGHO2_02_FULL_34_9 TaxID=1802206 RepID=A0A1G2HYK2_9BACT|nr:MAG: hypothetical protein A3D35_02555 [Candidatus Staskawiczbacteria bacterium RIFCSPHIGHO2_02_FULL_34_9]
MFVRDKFVWQWLGIALSSGMIFGLLSHRWDVFALMFTAVILFWYSVETSNLVNKTEKTRQEMVIANQISVQPILTLEYLQNGSTWHFRLKNIGKGSAMNIEIKSDRQEYIFELSGLNILKYDDEEYIELRKNSNPLSSEDWLLLSSEPIIATIIFYRTKKSNNKLVQLWTKVEIKNPSKTKIIETKWLPK